MATYQQVFDKIKLALTSRTAGTLVQATLLEEALIEILSYSELIKGLITASDVRRAHVNSTSGVPIDLVWNVSFNDTAYDYSINGFTSEGFPVEIILISKTASKLTVKTVGNAILTATAVAY
jgi:hypothetical protein